MFSLALQVLTEQLPGLVGSLSCKEVLHPVTPHPIPVPPHTRNPLLRLWLLQVLTEELPALVGSLSFKKSMRWRGDAAYSRPLRWLLALHGSTVLPFNYAHLQVGCGCKLRRACEM